MNRSIIAFIVGLIFAFGLGLGGMTQPQKIIAFLDLTAWDPSLLFVMAGAVGVHALLYPLVRRRKSPLLDSQFHVPESKHISRHLIFGSLIFGIGWGLGGYCPGPAVVSMASGQTAAFVFVAMMLVGMSAYHISEKFLARLK